MILYVFSWFICPKIRAGFCLFVLLLLFSKTTQLISLLFSYYDFKNMTRFPQDSLAEVEEKYKKAMVSNAQLDNEKTNFMYQVDTLKDMLLELEEQLAESRRQYEEKNKVSFRVKENGGMCAFGIMARMWSVCVCLCVCVFVCMSFFSLF